MAGGSHEARCIVVAKCTAAKGGSAPVTGGRSAHSHTPGNDPPAWGVQSEVRATLPAPVGQREAFDSRFGVWARRLRRRLVARSALTGAAFGLASGVGAASALFALRQGELRPLAATLGLAGAAAGWLLRRRNTLGDEEVALVLDRSLGTEEVVTTAVWMRSGEESDPARGVVLDRAAEALGSADARKVRTPVFNRWQILAPLSAAAIVALSLLPLPPAPPPPEPPPGAEIVKLADIRGLEKIEALAQMDARDEAQKKRLEELANEAKKLREKLRDGAPKREVQSDIAKLGDGLAAERLSLGDGEQRKGLESALGRLSSDKSLEKAAKALGDRDLTAFDEEMQKLASSAEKESREKAKKALEEAAEAARKEGAPDVAKMLEEQKKLFEQLEKKSEKLRELSKALEGAAGKDALGEEGQRALEEMGQSGSPEAQRKLAEALEKALKNMTDEERKRLADAMKKQIEEQSKEGGSAPPEMQDLEDLAGKLGTPEGQKALEDMLKQMAAPPEQGSEGERQKQLGDAERGLGELGQQLGGVPMPMPGQGLPVQNGGPPGDQGGSKGGPGGGVGKGPGMPKQAGETAKVDGGRLEARAATKLNPGAPMPGVVMGRTEGRAGETANRRGTGALGEVGAEEIEGVTRSDVPEEYREQVGRYFQP